MPTPQPENEDQYSDFPTEKNGTTVLEESAPILMPEAASVPSSTDSQDEAYMTTYLLPTHIEQKREETRGVLALIFIIGFFFMLTLGGGLVALSSGELESKVKNLQDVFLTISGVLSGPLGFVVGYYFRRQEEQDV